ncbi:hypothetical protein RI367_005931 [Sorochytrium milnesiophthora]
MPDRDPGVITSHSGLSFQTSRPLWISQDKVCVLATETTDQGQYNLQYTLPHLNSPEKCIIDNTTQPRNAAYSLTWKTKQCVLYQTENEITTVNYVVNGLNEQVCCDIGDCQSTAAKEAATTKDTNATASSFKWQNAQFCTFVSGQNELGYIAGGTRDQCLSLMDALGN